jgi:hypothetical protein
MDVGPHRDGLIRMWRAPSDGVATIRGMKRPVKICYRCGRAASDLHFRFAAGYPDPNRRVDAWACGPGTSCFARHATELERRIADAA